MQLVTFDALRTWDIPGLQRLKPEAWVQNLDKIKTADWILFPEYWQIPLLVFALKKQIFPSVNSYLLGYSKVDMTYAFQAVCPDHVPYTLILPRTDGVVETILEQFSFPFVAKEVRNAEGHGVFLIETRSELTRYVARNKLLYLQEYLPLDRDVRIVVVGREVVTAYWRIAPPEGFHNNVAQGGEISFEAVPAAAVELVEHVARELALDHAGFDVALVDGHPYLLEFNMRFGNQALTQRQIRLGSHILAYLRQQSMAPQTDPPPVLPLAELLTAVEE